MRRYRSEVPSFFRFRLQGEETSAARGLEDALHVMATQVDAFGAAVALFEFARENVLAAVRAGETDQRHRSELFSSWMFIAARDSGMTVYHFAEAMSGARQALNRSPTLRSIADSDALRLIDNLFKTRFPHFDKVRHAIAHAGEDQANPDKFRKHGFSGDYKGPGMHISGAHNIVSSCLDGSLFTNTLYGEVVQHDVSRQTLDHLADLMRRFFAAMPKEAQRAAS